MSTVFLRKKSFFFFYERAIDKLSSIRYSISCARDLYDFSKGTLTITRRSVAFENELYGGSLRCNPRVSLAFESAALAQLVEHHHGKVGVAGSSPAGGFLVKSQLFNKELGFFCFAYP